MVSPNALTCWAPTAKPPSGCSVLVPRTVTPGIVRITPSVAGESWLPAIQIIGVFLVTARSCAR